MSFESALGKLGQDLNPVEFGEAVFQTAIQNPINAISQLTGDKLPQLHLVNVDNDTLAAKFGSILGFVGDFAILNKFAGIALNPILGDASSAVWAGALKGGIAGAAYGGLLTPSSGDLLKSRLESAALYGGTFAVVGGLSAHMGNREAFKGAAIGGRIFGSAIVGGVGVADTVGASALSQHKLPTWEQIHNWSMTPSSLTGTPAENQGTPLERIQHFLDGLDPDNHTRQHYQPFQGYFGTQPSPFSVTSATPSGEAVTQPSSLTNAVTQEAGPSAPASTATEPSYSPTNTLAPYSTPPATYSGETAATVPVGQTSYLTNSLAAYRTPSATLNQAG